LPEGLLIWTLWLLRLHDQGVRDGKGKANGLKVYGAENGTALAMNELGIGLRRI